MASYVVDVNVPIVAEKKSDQTHNQCISACIKALEKILLNGSIVLDENWLIMKEYENHLKPKGEPGLGFAFLRWIYENKANPARCIWVRLNIGRDESEIEEFPRDQSLERFDRADRKYVAVSIASGINPIIVNAVDSDWWDYGTQLRSIGISIENLCSQPIRRPSRHE